MNYKYLGILDSNIANYWGLSEHKNKPIIVYEERKQHVIEKHLTDFGSIEKINEVYHNMSNIINNPDYVFYNEHTKGLEYYKKIDEDIIVAVRVNKSKVLKVKSWYPANKAKLKNRMRKDKRMKVET